MEEHEADDELTRRASQVSACALAVVVLVGITGAAWQLTLNLLPARGSGGNEAAAIGALKNIANAQTLFREGDKDQVGVLAYTGSLHLLGHAGPNQEPLIDEVLAAGIKQGYHFSMGTGRDPRFEFWAKACPVTPRETGSRFFYVDMAGRIYFSQFDFPVSDTLDPDNLPQGIHALGG